MDDLISLRFPWFVTNEQFITTLKTFCHQIFLLDCSECDNLNTSIFSQLEKKQIKFPKLKKFFPPVHFLLPDAVYESLSEIMPVLEELNMVRIPISQPADQLKNYSFFKKSNIRVIQDNPVLHYGRLNQNKSQVDKQKRQKWEQDLAKIAISCQKIESYVCNGGRSYLDDKSLERLAVLMPCLKNLELKRCSISDEGLFKFFLFNKLKDMQKLCLDEAGQMITDQSLNIIAENCPDLKYLKLIRNDNYSKQAVDFMFEHLKQLEEVAFDGREKREEEENYSKSSNLKESRIFNEESFVFLAFNNPLIKKLTFYRCNLSFKKILDLLGEKKKKFDCLESFSLYDCNFSNTSALLSFFENLKSLKSLSFVDCLFVNPEFVVNLIIKLPHLKSLCFFCRNKSFFADASNLAKVAYTMLTGENGGRFRINSLQSLTVQGISGQFLRLITAICSQITELDFRQVPLTSGSEDKDLSCVVEAEDLVEAITPCENLKIIEITSTPYAELSYLNDDFFKICASRFPNLEHLFINFSLKKVTKDSLSILLKGACRLESLILEINDCDIDEHYLAKTLRMCRGKYEMKIERLEEGDRVHRLARMQLKPMANKSRWFY